VSCTLNKTSTGVHDGGKKIQGYCVEYKDPSSGRWKIHNDIPTLDCKYTGKWLKRPVDVLFNVHDRLSYQRHRGR
jgi:hypothetical protein